MLPHRFSLTPFQEVNGFLCQLLASQKALLKEHLVGLYLGGSLALRAFNLDRSDIDFLAVTFEEFPPEVVLGLRNMHAQLYATYREYVHNDNISPLLQTSPASCRDQGARFSELPYQQLAYVDARSLASQY